MENCQPQQDLVGVLFPGIVKNEEKAIACLGGMKKISQVYNQNRRRLGVSFHPENPYVKKTYADVKNVAGVLLKVKVKKNKLNNEIKREVISTTVVGRVWLMYQFESLSDFQYLPVDKGVSDSKPQCILENLLPTGMDTVDFLQQAVPVFVLPSVFTRSDKPIQYSYTEKKLSVSTEQQEVSRDSSFHQRLRGARVMPNHIVVFNLTDDFPTEPHEYSIEFKNNKLKLMPGLAENYDAVKKIFDERPICSLNLIKYHTKVKLVQLKIIVPCLAFHMRDGPWRTTWIRYGYDPRKDPKSRYYQILDFRLRHTAGLHSMVSPRGGSSHNHKTVERVRQFKKSQKPTTQDEVLEGTVYFSPDIIVAQRQIFYQYCDIKIPEVEELLAAEPPPGFLCHEKRGWLAPKVNDLCRDYMFKYAAKTLLSVHIKDEEVNQPESSEEENSDDSFK